jgi:hypothetical protein
MKRFEIWENGAWVSSWDTIREVMLEYGRLIQKFPNRPFIIRQNGEWDL